MQNQYSCLPFLTTYQMRGKTQERLELQTFTDSLSQIRAFVKKNTIQSYGIGHTFSRLHYSQDTLLGVFNQSIYKVSPDGFDYFPLGTPIDSPIIRLEGWGSTLIVCTKDFIELYDIPTMTLAYERVDFPNSVGAITIDNGTLASLDNLGNLIRYDLIMHTPIEPAIQAYEIMGQYISCSLTSIATMGDRGLIYIWNLNLYRMQQYQAFEDSNYMAQYLCGHLVISSNTKMRVWHPNTINPAFQVSSEVTSSYVSSDHEFLFFFDGKLRCFNLMNNSQILISQKILNKCAVQSMAMSSDNKQLYLSLEGGKLLVLNLMEDYKLEQFYTADGDICQVTTKDDRLFLAVDNKLISYSELNIHSMPFNQTVKKVCIWGDEIVVAFQNQVKLIHSDFQGDIGMLEEPGLISFSLGASKIITLGIQPKIHMWNSDFSPCDQVFEYNIQKKAYEIILLPNESGVADSYIVGWFDDDSILVWETSQSLPQTVHSMHTGTQICGIARFNSTNSIIIFSSDKLARIVDVCEVFCVSQIMLPESVEMPLDSRYILVTEKDEFCIYSAYNTLYFLSIKDLLYLGSLSTPFTRYTVNAEVIYGWYGDQLFSLVNPCALNAVQTTLCDYKYTFVCWQSILLFSDRNSINQMITQNIQSNPLIYSTMIMPNCINFLHYFVHYGRSQALNTALQRNTKICTEVFAFKTPLSIALNKWAIQDINTIIKEASRMLNSDPNIYLRFQQDLETLNRSSVQALPLFYTTALREPIQKLPKVGEKLERIVFSDSTSILIDISKFLKVGVEQLVDSQLLAPERLRNAKNQLILFKVSAFRLDFTLGSNQSIDFLRSLLESKNPLIFKSALLKAYLDYKWQKVLPMLLTQAAQYILSLFMISLFIIYRCNSYWIMHILFILNVFHLIAEGFQFTSGVLTYLSDLLNILDLLKIILLFIYYVIFQIAGPTESTTALLAFITLAMWIRGISYFRIRAETRYLSKMIYQIVLDMQAFMLILLYAIISFALVLYVTGNNKGVKTFGESWTESFMIGFGDFSADDYNPFEWVTFILATLINPLVLMNLLIALMGGTYERVAENELEADMKSKAGYILEYELILRWNRNKKNMKFFHYCGVVGESIDEGVEDDEIVDSFQKLDKQIGSMTDSIDRVLKNTRDTYHSLTDKIQKAQNSFSVKVINQQKFMRKMNEAILLGIGDSTGV